MATKPSEPTELGPRERDVRASRPYLLSRGTARATLRRVVAIAVLAALDALGLALGLYAALVLRSIVFGDPIFWNLLWEAGPAEWLPFLIPITWLVFWQAGLYAGRERRAGAGKIASSIVLVAAITLAFGWGTNYDFTTSGLIPTACVTSALAIGLLRAAYESITLELQRLLHVRRRVLLVGDDEHLDSVERVLTSSRRLTAYDVVGSFTPGRDGSLAARLEQVRPDEIVLSEGGSTRRPCSSSSRRRIAAASACGSRRRRPSCCCSAASTCRARACRCSSCSRPCSRAADWALKKAFDLGVSFVVVVLGLPLWLLIALAIKLDSRGPVLYRDRRIGVGEREFGMLKFRTMVQGAAEQQAVLEEHNEAGGALFKIRDDPRVTRVGRLLRRLSIDELPQVLNVLGGEMSLVGPRPLPLRDYRQLEAWHRKRYHVLPGITGLWQISGRSNLTFDDLVRLDFYYIENWSIWLDISILVKTLPAVLAGRGAY